MPHTQTGTESRLILDANEIEDAFMAACDANAIRDPELLAELTKNVCFWHRIDDAARSRVLTHIRDYFPIH
jgi:hypothetical protein